MNCTFYRASVMGMQRWRLLPVVPTTSVSPSRRNAAPSINPAASNFCAQATPASSAASTSPSVNGADVAGDEARAEVAVGLQFIGRTADNRGVAGQIDGIGDDGGGGIGL